MRFKGRPTYHSVGRCKGSCGTMGETGGLRCVRSPPSRVRSDSGPSRDGKSPRMANSVKRLPERRRAASGIPRQRTLGRCSPRKPLPWSPQGRAFLHVRAFELLVPAVNEILSAGGQFCLRNTRRVDAGGRSRAVRLIHKSSKTKGGVDRHGEKPAHQGDFPKRKKHRNSKMGIRSPVPLGGIQHARDAEAGVAAGGQPGVAYRANSQEGETTGPIPFRQIAPTWWDPMG